MWCVLTGTWRGFVGLAGLAVLPRSVLQIGSAGRRGRGAGPAAGKTRGGIGYVFTESNTQPKKKGGEVLKKKRKKKTLNTR
jgi:hypothetical protein